MALRPIQYAFTAGELTPKMGGRVDVSRYHSGCARLENFRTLPTGGAERRPGTLFIARTKYPEKPVRLERFEFSTTQAYVLEMGEHYIRFYTQLGRLEVDGVPVEVTTPYHASDLFQIQCVQSADVLYCVHPDHPPSKLLRLGATDWSFETITFRPPPGTEVETDLEAALELSDTSGLSVTATCASELFLDGDVDRQLVAGAGRAVITALVGSAPSTQATLLVLSDFATTTLASSGWRLTGSPVCALRPSKRGPVGARVRLTLERPQADEPELVSNRKFQQGETSWTDLSNTVIASGTATGSGANLVDSGADFVAAGVLPTQTVYNLTDGSSGGVGSVTTTQVTMNPTLSGGSGNTWDAGDSYEIRGTGTFAATGGEAQLVGGTAGVGACQQAVSTVSGRRYQTEFVVRGQALSHQVGSTSGGSELLSESAYNVGEHTESFTATGSTSYLQFRNNQNQIATLDDVSCKLLSAQGWRPGDVGKLVTAADGGTVEITQYVDATEVRGIIWAPFPEVEDEDEAQDELLIQAGAWVLAVYAWSETQGYPKGIGFHQGRLGLAGTPQQPLTGWESVSGDFENFAMGTQADDALEWTISANTMSAIEWMEPLTDLLVGTRGGEHLITGGGQKLTPTNIGQDPQGTYGSAPLRPLLVGDASLLMLQRGSRKVQEYVLADDSGIYRARDVTVMAEHITRSGIKQWCYQRQPTPTAWAVRHDGQLIGWTFDLQEEVRGWHRHTTQGRFESLATCPVDTPDDDETEQLWVACVRTVGGQDVRSIEVFRGEARTSTATRAGLTVDCALQYRGEAATVFSGLEHLEACTVRLVGRSEVEVEVNGETITTERLINLGTQVVTGAQVTSSVAVEMLDVGLDYLPTLVTLKPEVALQDGTLQMRRKRWVELFVRIMGGIGLTINGQQVPVRTTTDAMGLGLLPADVDVTAFGSGWDRSGQVTLTQPLPFPVTILALVGDLDVGDAE